MAILSGWTEKGEGGEQENFSQFSCGLVNILQEDGGGVLQPTRNQ